MTTMSAEEQTRQRARLATYRGNLAHLLQQAASYGGEGAVPLDIHNAIIAQRAAIAQLKAALRPAGVAVDDHADDGDAPPSGAAAAASPAPAGVQGSVTVASGGTINGIAAGVITGDVTGGTFTFGGKEPEGQA